MKKNVAYLVLSLMFFALLLLPGLFLVILPGRTFSETENRALASLPTFSVETLMNGEWQEGIENYLKDQFVGRDVFCQLCNTTKSALGYRDFSGAYLCDDGYLCEKVTDADLDGEQYKGNLDKLNDFALKYPDRKVTVMLVPSASTVKTDGLPLFAPVYASDTMFDEAAGSLPDCTFLDLRKPFRQQADQGLYYRTDHHWTYKGASLAYEAYCESAGLTAVPFTHTLVAQEFYGTLWSKTLNIGQTPDEVYAPDVSSAITTDHKIGTLYDTDALARKDKYTYFLGGNDGLVTVSNPTCTTGKKLLLIKDSFANAFLPYLTEHYEEIAVVDLRYYNSRLSQLIDGTDFDDILVLYSMTSFAQSGELGRLKL